MAAVLRFLVEALALFFVLRMISALFMRSSPAPTRPSSPASGERAGGTLVRDPNCGTYIPEAGAIRLGSGDKTLFFCSATCRDAYQARS